MNFLKPSGLFIFIIILLSSCSDISGDSWMDAVPEKASFVIIPEEEATLNSVLESSYTPLLDDMTSAAVQLLSRVDSTAQSPISLNAIMLYPATNNQLDIVWMTQADKGSIDRLQDDFYKDFEQNQYTFKDINIHILHLDDRQVFAAQVQDDLFLSESSLGLEDAIRAYIGEQPRANLDDISPEPGHIIMNTPSIDQWIQQLSLVTYRPIIKNALQGTSPTLLSVSQEGEGQESKFNLNGNISIDNTNNTDLVAALSSEKAPLTMDRYISSNAAAASIFRLPPRTVPPSSLSNTTRLDSLLIEDQVIYPDLAQSLDSEFAMVMYTQSGFLTSGEHLFLRKISDQSALRNSLNSLVQDDYIDRTDGTYVIQSNVLAQLVGSSFCTFQNFYLDIVDDVIVISKRKGLVEAVASDRNRRRTLYYEQSFRDIKSELPDQVSGFFIGNNDLFSFLEPFLAPNNNLNALTSKFDLFTAYTSTASDGNIAFNFTTHQTQDRSAPYREKWLFPTGSDLTGTPTLTDIGGSDQQEIIFSTKSGEVYTLAADGTVVMQANTGNDTPIGPPVVYDWYGTNQNIILQAAGNKIYAWNENGQSLPKFPFELNEEITAPLIVDDVDRNGIPNAMVATADRKLHLLDGRGENISGWPVTTNAEITTLPTIENYRGEVTIFAFAENALHGWNSSGSEKENFPKFINAALNGSPVLYNNNILGNAADGYLYSIGSNTLFADSLNVFDTSTESSEIEAVYASNSGLVGNPSVHDLVVEEEEETYDETMILTVSSSGSVFLINTEGQLRFTQSMGQPAAPKLSPFITDIDQNGEQNIIALANFGRLYVWEVRSGERIYTVPTSGMQYPIVADIDSDGYNELIAQTSEGVRTWTIFGQEDEEDTEEEDNPEEKSSE